MTFVGGMSFDDSCLLMALRSVSEQSRWRVGMSVTEKIKLNGQMSHQMTFVSAAHTLLCYVANQDSAGKNHDT